MLNIQCLNLSLFHLVALVRAAGANGSSLIIHNVGLIFGAWLR